MLKPALLGSLLASAVAVASGCGDDAGGSGGAGASTATGSAGSTVSGGGDATGATGATGSGGDPGDECPSGTRCVAEPPADWTGPAALFVGETAPGECASPWMSAPVRGNLQLQGSHACSACACSAATGAGCPTAQMTVYGDGGCTTSSATFTLVEGVCTNTNGGYGAKAAVVTPSGGSCTQTGGKLEADAPTWQLEALVCGGAPPAGMCSAGICAVEPTEPFGPAVCIHKDGDEACPDGFPARTLVYGDFADTRSCTACGCGAPSGIACPINTYAGACGNMGIALDQGGACDNDNYYSVARLGPATGGSCAPSGGEPAGSLDPISPITVCCAP